jgi:hypothetical protein
MMAAMSRLLPALLGIVIASAAFGDDGWQTYRGEGFSIQIPPGWRANPKFVDYGYGYYQDDPTDKLAGTAFTTTADLQPGSNLRSDQSYVLVEFLPPGRKCTADNFLVDPPPDYFTTAPEQTPDFLRTVAEPGDLYGEEHQIHVVSHTPCVAVQYVIEYGQLDADRLKTERPFDRAGLLALLDRIRGSLVLTRP